MIQTPRITLYEGIREYWPVVDGSTFYPRLNAGFKTILADLGYVADLNGYCKSFDIDYLVHSGGKRMQKAFFLNYMFQCEETYPASDDYDWENILSGDYDCFDDPITEEMFAKSYANIKHIYDAYKATYNPLNNYDMEEDIDFTPAVKTTVETSIAENTNTSNSDKRNGFGITSDPASEVVTSQSGNTTRLDTANKQKTTTSFDGATDNTHTERKGNIGVMTTQALIREEIDLRKMEIIEMIFGALDDVLVESVY